MEKRKGLFLFLIFLLFVTVPIVSAQTYSGFNRFTDNVKLFFSSGENKVNLALEIREKEINSALENVGDDEATKNLERARNKLLVVQEKVSVDNAEKVKTNVDEVINKVNNYENLSDEFETYLLEEEKTQLTAELVIEVDGKEGQTLTREVVKNESTGQNMVRIVVVGENGEEIITEIQGQINQIQNNIAERVVKMDIAKNIDKADLEDGVYVAKGDGGGNEGLSPEIKTDIESGGNVEDEIVENEGEDYAPGTSGDSPGDVIDDTYDDDVIEGGDCGDGVDCGDGSADPGVEGTNDVAPAVDSNEGDSEGESVITGEVILSDREESFLMKFFRKIFG